MACGATNQQGPDDASTSIAIEEDSDSDADSDEPDEPPAKPSSSWESDNNPNPEIGWYACACIGSYMSAHGHIKVGV